MTNTPNYWKRKLSASSIQSISKKSLNDFHRIDTIKSWAYELAELKKNRDINNWDLIGRGILFLTNHLDDGKILTSLAAKNAGFNFISVPKFEVIEAFKIELPKSLLSPCLIYLEPGDWMKSLDKEKPDQELESLQRYLQDLILNFDPIYNVIFTTSVKSLADIDLLFRRQGVFDRRFEITERTLYEKGHDFVKQVGIDICDESITDHLEKVGKFIDCEFDDFRVQGLISVALRRIQKRINRPLSFLDLVDISSHGSGERDPIPINSDKYFDMIAVHEAGHVAAAILDSNGVHIPDYASAFPSRDFSGIVVDSFEHMKNIHRQMTYRDYEHKIRIGLGGRIAEHFIFGAENITVNTASADLENTTNMCRTMFGSGGISLDMKDPESVSNNLMVIVDRSTTSEDTHLENLTRQYLKKQYDYVFNLFTLNKNLIINIKDRLKTQRVLDQSELSSIYKSYLSLKNKKWLNLNLTGAV